MRGMIFLARCRERSAQNHQREPHGSILAQPLNREPPGRYNDHMNRRAFLGAASAFGFAALTQAQQTNPPSKMPVQQPPARRPDELSIITVDVTRVSLLFTVTDRKGRFVTDLTKEDFEVIETKKPQLI